MLKYPSLKKQSAPTRDETLQKKSNAFIYRSHKAPEWTGKDGEVTVEEEVEDTDILNKKRGPLAQRFAERRQALFGQIKTIDADRLNAKAQRPKFRAEVVDEADGSSVIASSAAAARVAKMEGVEATAGSRTVAGVAANVDVSSLKVAEVADQEGEGEEEVASRRARIRERLKRQQQEKEAAAAAPAPAPMEEEAEEEEEEEESEEESEEEMLSAPRLKPVFISKKDRETIKERERLEQEEIEAEKMVKDREAQRKKETKMLVVEQMAREEEMKLAAKLALEEELPDDRDDEENEQELELWKLRELRRIKRDQEERDTQDKEQEEIERRRNMTDAEIEAEDRAKLQEKPKVQMQFLQKYYHKGAYYQDEPDEVFNRNFMEPTGEDALFDKQALPQVLQVKKFGIKGRTKYTHLTDQDTTKRDQNPWANSAYKKPVKLAGMGPVAPAKKTK